MSNQPSSGPQRILIPSGKGRFYFSMREADASWRQDLIDLGAGQEHIVYDDKDQLPKRDIIVRKNVPFLRYGFRSERRVERVLKSLSFLRRSRRGRAWESDKDLRIGTFMNTVSHRHELFVWGPEFSPSLYNELIEVCEQQKGEAISALAPVDTELAKLVWDRHREEIIVSDRSTLTSPRFIYGDKRFELRGEADSVALSYGVSITRKHRPLPEDRRLDSHFQVHNSLMVNEIQFDPEKRFRFEGESDISPL